VIDAIYILRHEKIGRWVKQSWVWAEDPDYDLEAVAVAEGKRDRVKQDRLYVRLSSDGGIASVPSGSTYEIVRNERELGSRLASLAEGVLECEKHPGLDYYKVEEVFKVLFESIADEQGA